MVIVQILPTKNLLITKKVAISVSLSGNGEYATNLKTLLDNSAPSGYSCIGISGYNIGNGEVYASNLCYNDSGDSLYLHNTTQYEKTLYVIVYGLYKLN